MRSCARRRPDRVDLQAGPAQAKPLEKTHFHDISTGSFKVYGPDGKLLFSDPGQIRFEILVDHGGTPADPSDDEELAFLGIVKGSTGRNDLAGRDFCADIHEFIG